MRTLVFTLLLATFPAEAGLLPKIDCRKALSVITEKSKRVSYKVTAAGKGLLHRTQRIFYWLATPRSNSSQQGPTQGNYPRSGRTLQARNKNSEQSGSSGGPLSEAASIDVAGLQYWKQAHLVTVDPITATASAPKGHRILEPEERDPDQLLTVTPNGALPDYLLIPEGYRPFLRQEDTEHFLLYEDPSGNLMMKSHSDAPLKIPLAVETPTQLTDKERAQYTKVRKVPTDMWPDWLQKEISFLHRKRSAGWSDSRIVDHLSRFIQKNDNLLYRVDEDPSFGVVDMMNRGGCQCDGAATTAVTLLRGEFNIPARVVQGFTGSRKSGEQKPRTVVAYPTQGHAWIESYPSDVGRWIISDPTPVKTDRPKKDELENSGYEQLTRNDVDGDEENGNPHNNKDSENKDGDSSEEGKDKGEDSAGNESRPLPKDMPLGPNQKQQEQYAFTHAQWIHALEGADNSSTLRRRLEDFVARNKNSTLNRSIPPYLEAAEKLLSQLSAIQRHYESAQDLSQAESHDRPSLRVIERVLEELSESREMTTEERKALMSLRAHFPKSNTEKPDTVVLGYTIFKEYEGTLFEPVIRNLFGNGNNSVDYRAFGEALEGGYAQPFLQMLRVGHFLDTDFLKIPEWTKRTEIGAAHPIPYPGHSIGVERAGSMEDLPRLIDKGKPFEIQAFELLSGSSLKWTHMERTLVEKDVFDDRFAKNWVIISDHSGSMGFDPRAWIRDALTYVAIDRAYADDPKNTRVNHISYGNKPQAPIVLSTPEDATRFLQRKMKKRPDVWRDGNNTALALAKGFEIARNNSEKDKELNILLISDGDEHILMDRIKEELDKLDSGINVYLNVVTLVIGNDDLKKIAEGQTDIDVKGRYSFLSLEDVEDLASNENGLNFVADFAVPHGDKTLPDPVELRETLRGLSQSLYSTQRRTESIPREFPLLEDSPLPTPERERIFRLYLEAAASLKGWTPEEVRQDITGERP